MPRIDVVVPVRNSASTISASLLSIACQTIDDFRVIIVDDGSIDNTLDLVDVVAERSGRVVVIKNPGNGIVSALNAGLEYSDAEYVVRMDGDDLSFPNRLERQLNFMQDQPKLVMSGTRVMKFGIEHSLPAMVSSPEDCRVALSLFSPFFHPTVIMRSMVLHQNNIRYSKNHEYAEDYKLFSDLSFVGDVANINEPLLMYRTHSGQVSKTKSNAQRQAGWHVAVEHIRRTSEATQLAPQVALFHMARTALRLGPKMLRRSANAMKNQVMGMRLARSNS